MSRGQPARSVVKPEEAFKILGVQIFATSRSYLSDVKNAFADQTILEVSTSTKDIEESRSM